MSYVTTRFHRAPKAVDQRQHLRFDKVFPVRVESILFGVIQGIARNVSAGGIFIAIRDPLPLGSRVRVSFLNPQATTEIVAVGEVKNHYFMNYVHEGTTQSVTGMAVRFESFEEDSHLALVDCLNRLRVLN